MCGIYLEELGCGISESLEWKADLGKANTFSI